MILEALRQGHLEEKPCSRNGAPETTGPTGSDDAEIALRAGHFRAKEAVIHDAAGLAWAINMGCVDLNPHPVLAGDLDHPDELRVDLDPMPGSRGSEIVDVALVAREVPSGLRPGGVAEDVRLARAFVIYARIAPLLFRQVRLAAQTAAREVEAAGARRGDAAAGGRRSAKGVRRLQQERQGPHHVASAYSVRATPDARVSTPLHWD